MRPRFRYSAVGHSLVEVRLLEWRGYGQGQPRLYSSCLGEYKDERSSHRQFEQSLAHKHQAKILSTERLLLKATQHQAGIPETQPSSWLPLPLPISSSTPSSSQPVGAWPL